MADENQIETPPVVEGQQPVTPEPAPAEPPQYTETEQRAMEMGWKPKDQWTGSPDDHRSAKEFLDRGELLGKLRAQGSELKEVKEALRYLTDVQRRTYQNAYEQALVDLKKQKVDAVERGDGEAVVQIDEAIDNTKQAIAAAKVALPKPAAPSPHFDNWVKRNEWYLKDKSKKVWADMMAIQYAQEQGRVDEEEIYEYLDKEARNTFPQLFQKPSNTVAPPSPDGNGRSAAGGAKATPRTNPEKAFKDLVATFPEFERRAAEKLVRDGYVTAEEFVRDFH